MSNIFDPNYTPIIINFRVGQKVVVFNSRGEILFLRRSQKVGRAGGWDFPGGGLEHEDPAEGIRREAFEEAGLTLHTLRVISVITQEHKDENTMALFIGYVSQLASDKKVVLSWEHDAYKWLSVEDALKVELPEMHREFLVSAIKNVTNG